MRKWWHGDYIWTVNLVKISRQLCERIVHWEISDFPWRSIWKIKVLSTECLFFFFWMRGGLHRILAVNNPTEKGTWYYLCEGAAESFNHLLFHCWSHSEVGALQALGMLSWMLGFVEVSVGRKKELLSNAKKPGVQ